ncbi:MAG: ankyrin repeat domain-containing protein [Wolbachia sp.]
MHFENYLPLMIALFGARDSGDFSLLNLLLTNSANPNIKVYYDETPLYCIGILEDSRIVELLLKHGANLDIKNESGGTPLIVASGKGYYETAKILLEYKADLNIQDKYGNTPLSKASFRGHYKIVELLLKHGAGKESESVNKALLEAVRFHEHGHDKEKTVELLLKYGANLNEKNYHMRLIERAPYFANSGIINCIKTIVLPYGSNDKVKKLMAEYGGVDRCYLRDQTILTCCCLIVASATLFSMASPWRYIPKRYLHLPHVFSLKIAVQAAFFAKTKEPFPEFAEVLLKKLLGQMPRTILKKSIVH